MCDSLCLCISDKERWFDSLQQVGSGNMTAETKVTAPPICRPPLTTRAKTETDGAYGNTQRKNILTKLYCLSRRIHFVRVWLTLNNVSDKIPCLLYSLSSFYHQTKTVNKLMQWSTWKLLKNTKGQSILSEGQNDEYVRTKQGKRGMSLYEKRTVYTECV